jgi:hypothetical protein
MTPTSTRPDAREINSARLRRLGEIKPRILMVAGMWSAERLQPDFRETLAETLKSLCSSAEHVIVLGQPPMVELPKGYEQSLRKYLVARSLSRSSDTLRASQDVPAANRLVAEVVATSGARNIEFVNPHDLFINSGNQAVELVQGGEFLYSDDRHLNDAGAAFVCERLLSRKILRRLQFSVSASAGPSQR